MSDPVWESLKRQAFGGALDAMYLEDLKRMHAQHEANLLQNLAPMLGSITTNTTGTAPSLGTTTASSFEGMVTPPLAPNFRRGPGGQPSRVPLDLPALPTALVAGPIVAHRLWRVASLPDGRRLSALHHGQVLEPGLPMRAVCTRPRADMRYCPAPARDCVCGIYAMKDPTKLDAPTGLIVQGRVALWGRVIEHAEGYRAQYAYPVALSVWRGPVPMPGFPRPEWMDATVRELAAIYGCAVEA